MWWLHTRGCGSSTTTTTRAAASPPLLGEPRVISRSPSGVLPLAATARSSTTASCQTHVDGSRELCPASCSC
ncbi:hypothetical protein E2C01_056837 [Portunus trituberculatus]|uniref:Uncharacterized protein n=1 Tax=Portunus trituberculatus TaxID=210409 RepID=A0A5B7H085_PORTR|nr:hypothetical protein [Portunus trituberculatus]